MFEKSTALVQKKGADYNRDKQQEGDTLFNLRVAELMGIVPTAERGILVRLMDKMMRLVSLVHPDRDPAVTDESVLDTVADVHNYVDYLALMHQQRKAEKALPGSPAATLTASTIPPPAARRIGGTPPSAMEI